jgi:hypothetical protein
MLTFSILRLACADALLLYLALADKVGSRYVTELASTEQEPMYAHVVAGNAVSLPPSCRPDAAWMCQITPGGWLVRKCLPVACSLDPATATYMRGDHPTSPPQRCHIPRVDSCSPHQHSPSSCRPMHTLGLACTCPWHSPQVQLQYKGNPGQTAPVSTVGAAGLQPPIQYTCQRLSCPAQRPTGTYQHTSIVCLESRHPTPKPPLGEYPASIVHQQQPAHTSATKH